MLIGNKNSLWGKGEKPFTLLFKTSSTRADWYLYRFGSFIETAYIAIDNTNGNIIKEGTFSHNNNMEIDLSQGNGDTSIYVDIPDEGSDTLEFHSFYNIGNFTYINLEAMPLLTEITLYNNNETCIFNGTCNNLVKGNFAYITPKGLDLSGTTKLTSITAYAGWDIPIDVSNNPLLESYVVTDYCPSFNVLNHPKLVTLKYKDTVFDTNINNTILPDLRTLYLTELGNIDFDFSSVDVSLVTKMQLCCNTVIGLNSFTSLDYLFIKSQNDTTFDFTGMNLLRELRFDDLYGYVGVLDLKPLLNLSVFTLAYGRHPGITYIDIANGLNSQVTKFIRLYVNGLLDVKVDDPIAANAEQAPYLPTVWVKTYNGNDNLNWI